MPTTVVRYTAILVALLGITLFIWRTASTGSGTGYDTVRLIHILVALGLFGVFEATLARTKRAKALNSTGLKLGMVARILLTLTLLVGIILLLSEFLNWFSGGPFDDTVYLHVILGLSAVIVAGILFTRRFMTSRKEV
jgi:hypothetical protein